MADWPFEIPSTLAEHLSRYTPVKSIRSRGPEHLHVAEDKSAQRLVLVKVLLENGTTNPEGYARQRQLLLRSGINLSRLKHPNIVATEEFGASPDGVFVIMEYLEGGSLRDKLSSFGAIGGEDLSSMAEEVGSALDYAHEAGLVHCEIRPEKILFDAAGKCRVMGFSAARSPGATSMGGAVSLPRSLIYAAPEQLQGNILPATDQFSLAAVIYRALTGSRPFRATALVSLIRQILLEPPDPPTRIRPGLPKALDAVMLQALAKNPDDRFRDCRQFAAAFEETFGSRRLWSGAGLKRALHWKSDRSG